MADAANQLVVELHNAGERLAHPPASLEDLLNLLDEVELLLGNVDQSAPPVVQQALLPAMKAFVADQLFRHSDMDVRIAVAACLHEIMRLTAPDAPYNDERMKEILELIVTSFNNLTLVSGRAYTKAVSILDGVSKLRSCVMMLDLECDALIIEMFQQFQKNMRSDHPDTVFSAMESIMTLVIDESEDISLELLKVILSFVRKENQDSLPMAWKLGSKVIEDCFEKLAPYLVSAVNSMEISAEDYGSVVASISEYPSHASEQNQSDGERVQVTGLLESNATNGKVVQSNNGSEHVVSPQCEKSEPLSSRDNKHPEFSSTKHIEKPKNADERLKTETEMGSKKIPHSKDKRPSSTNTNRGRGRPSLRGIEQSDVSLLVQSRAAAMSGGLVLEDEHQHSDGTKKRAKHKEPSEVSGEKRVTSKLKGHSSGNNENQEDKNKKKVGRRKQNLVTDEVFETPHGIKYYKEDLVGCRVKVWWPKDKAYYEGVVAEFDPSKMKHRIEYDDGDEEILNMRKEIWELIGNDDEETDGKVAQLLSNLQQQEGSTKDKELGGDSNVKSNEEHKDAAGDSRADATEKSRDPDNSEAKRRRLVKGQKA